MAKRAGAGSFRTISSVLRYNENIPTVLIGIGSNINPKDNLRKAAKRLRKRWPNIRFSSVYRSAPLERTDQPDFLNAAAAFGTEEIPESILSTLQSIEAAQKKAPPHRSGPRTIDLDLLLYGDEIYPSEKNWRSNSKLKAQSSKLMIPHPRLHLRRFVLGPLTELIGPDSPHPVLHHTLGELLAQLSDQRCTKTELLL